jgi:hypothetical protein
MGGPQAHGNSRRSLPELTQSEPLQQTLHLRDFVGYSLSEWWRLSQHPDFTLDMQEWEHALRKWKAANWPRCRCECDLFDMCLTCITHRQLTDLVQ